MSEIQSQLATIQTSTGTVLEKQGSAAFRVRTRSPTAGYTRLVFFHTFSIAVIKIFAEFCCYTIVVVDLEKLHEERFYCIHLPC